MEDQSTGRARYRVGRPTHGLYPIEYSGGGTVWIDYPLCFSKIRNAKKFIVQANNLYKQGEEKIMDRTLQNLINRSLELEKEINNLNPGHRTKAVDRKYRPIIKTGLYICILWTGIFGLVVGGYIY